MTDIFTSENAKKFMCDKCNFICSKTSDWNRHIVTRKHLNTDIILTNTDYIAPKNAKHFQCNCGNVYKHRQSLFTHKKKCTHNDSNFTSISSNQTIEDIDKESLIKMLLKNQDVMEKMMEVLPHMGSNTISNMTNSHNITNNQFNIQMFLNDHCKNAMNLTDFIHSLPITSETYDDTIENGLTKTITNMMVNGLNELDILDRPIHCTDATRKTLYVKDADKWEKDSELLHVLKGIKELSLKQRTMINKWKEANDGWKTDDKLQSRMTNLVFNSMTQIENDEKETSKIIRSISKKVYLDNETKKGYLTV